MSYTAEQHLQMAKLIRQKAMAFPADKRAEAVKKSNFFLALAARAAKDRGGLDLRGFDFDALPPDWSDIDRQIAKLMPIEVDERTWKLSKRHAELWERIRAFQDSRQADTGSSRLGRWWSRLTRW